MRVSRIPALLITAMMIPAISGCTTQGSPAPDAAHQIEDGGPAVYDDDPIAVEPQLDEDELDGDSDDANVQGRSFRRNRIKGVRIEKSIYWIYIEFRQNGKHNESKQRKGECRL